MAYPTSIKSFTFKRNNIDKVVADDVNTAYTEITEIERQLGGITTTSGGLAGVGVVKSDWGTGTFSTSISNWYSNDGLGARLKNIEAGLYQVLVTSSFGNITTGTLTTSGQSSQFPISIQLNESTHATSRRASTVFGTWVVGQDSAGSGTKDFFIYGGTSAANRMIIGTDGSITVGGTINGTTIPSNATLLTTTSTTGLYALKSGTTFTGKVTLNNDIASAPLVIPAPSAYPNDGTIGSVEFYNNSLYFTPNTTSGQGSLPTNYFIAVSSTDKDLNGAVTTEQSAFGKSLPLKDTTIYQFEILLYIAASSNAARTVNFTLPGITAGTSANVVYSTNTFVSTTGNDTTFTGTTTPVQYQGVRATGGQSLQLLGTGSVSWYGLFVRITGFIYTVVNQTNYFNPSVTFGTAVGGTPKLKVGSYARIWQIGNRSLGDGTVSWSGSWA